MVVIYAAYSYSKGGQGAAETLAGRILPDPKRSEYGIVRD
ncbi:hypothetical protein D5b_00097 [Faustovirus]|nr:hypothetical protein D5b_00097 [Faustovirus]AMN84813.1 hypothetical protein D6_00413 [Faustovirus]AMP44055.1 hypothetical protein PRJ_Dakar_00096 [Faustovirus]